jgi:hypothetical protein
MLTIMIYLTLVLRISGNYGLDDEQNKIIVNKHTFLQLHITS